MSKKSYFFIMSIPKHELIEYTTKLSSYISKLFPGRENPLTIKHLEINEDYLVIKATIKSSEDRIRDFADRFFQKRYELVNRNGEIEIVSKDFKKTNSTVVPESYH